MIELYDLKDEILALESIKLKLDKDDMLHTEIQTILLVLNWILGENQAIPKPSKHIIEFIPRRERKSIIVNPYD